MATRSSGRHLVVAAIDFGTTFSGWAFSFKHQYENDPSNVYVKNWNNGEHLSQKTPTTLLINSDGKTLKAFGYDAEDMYTDMETEEERHSYYFFRRFKMLLYNKKNISRDMELEAANGKRLPAILVFQLAIQYLKENLLEESSKTVAGGLKEGDIHWCLTVPAIWNDKAKKFMREAAIKAGINSFDLTIVLEPEAASALCQHLPVDKLEGGSMTVIKPGTTYMVIDCGGGTTDICCHELLENKQLKEIHRPSGAAIGGTHVDDAFESLFVQIVGRAVGNRFSEENQGDVLSLFRSFEVKKRKIAQSKSEVATFTLPMDLGNHFRNQDDIEVQSALSKICSQDEVKVLKSKNKIQINHKFLIRKTFDDVVKGLKNLLQLTVSTNPRVEETKFVLLVGGLSESVVIRDAVKEILRGKPVITIQEPSLAVVKGAVVYGHNESVVKSRIASYTYGFLFAPVFDPAIHDESMSYIETDGSKRIELFRVIVTAGEELSSDHIVNEGYATPVNEDQTEIHFRIFAVDAENEIPVYIKDPRVFYLGKVTAPITDKSVHLDKRKFWCTFKFGGTEISAIICEVFTGKTTEDCIDFLG